MFNLIFNLSLMFWFFTLLNIKNKLMCLLLMEMLFMITMFGMSIFYDTSNTNITSLLLTTVFMVIDSVLGASILIGTSRDSSKLSVMMSNF